MIKDEAMKLALRSIRELVLDNSDDAPALQGVRMRKQKAEKALREALAQPKQEPVAFASHGVVNWIADKQFQHEANLYIALQRTWVGLTNKEFAEILCDDRWQGRPELMMLQVQAKLKEKNT